MVGLGRVFTNQPTLTKTFLPHFQQVDSGPAGLRASVRWVGPTGDGLLGARIVSFWTDDGLQNLLENCEGSSAVKCKFQKTASIKLATGEISLSKMMGCKGWSLGGCWRKAGVRRGWLRSCQPWGTRAL